MKVRKDFVLRETAGDSVIIPAGRTAQSFDGLITGYWTNPEKLPDTDIMMEDGCRNGKRFHSCSCFLILFVCRGFP